MSYPYILQGSNITIVIDNMPHTIDKTHVSYDKIVDAVKKGLWEQVKELVNPVTVIHSYCKNNVAVVGGELFWRGKPLHNSIVNRMVQMMNDGFDIEPLANFMENLMQNPSKKSVDELYTFLEKNNLPITPDGHFLAYKRVRDNYMDCHTGTMDNSVGKIVEMERNQVDDDRDNTCSTGLHFCSQEYLKSFGGERTVIVKINPKDVVSIPSDYNASKGRTCRYEVIGEVDRNPNDSVEFNKPVQTNANSIGDGGARRVLRGGRYNDGAWPFPVNKTGASENGPKLGSTPFYRGYTDGFTGEENYAHVYWYDSDKNDYSEGYNKGQLHRDQDMPARYSFDDSKLSF